MEVIWFASLDECPCQWFCHFATSNSDVYVTLLKTYRNRFCGYFFIHSLSLLSRKINCQKHVSGGHLLDCVISEWPFVRPSFDVRARRFWCLSVNLHKSVLSARRKWYKLLWIYFYGWLVGNVKVVLFWSCVSRLHCGFQIHVYIFLVIGLLTFSSKWVESSSGRTGWNNEWFFSLNCLCPPLATCALILELIWGDGP